MASAALVAAVVAPASASALLTNEWNQQFAGTAACVECHGSTYNATSHGQFANTGTAMAPASDSAMWPVGLASNGAVEDATGVIALGGGTGLYEYIKFDADASRASTAGIPFVVLTAEWDPSEPHLWEIDGTAGVEYEDYGCNQCHQLGAVKKNITPPAVGEFADGGAFSRVAGTANTWAIPAGADETSFTSYLPGMGIQCERCHGTGQAATVDNGGHWNVGVKIVGYNTPAMKSTAKAASTNILDSEVCGQCHGSFKSGGNIAGYTADQAVYSFVPNFYTLADVPTEASFTANPAAYKFYPNGENKGNKHVYYTEWALSGHSVRGLLTSVSPDALPYQASGASHYSSTGSSRLMCNRCHTGEGYLKRKGASIMSGWTENTTDAGKLGQECAVCHVSHGSVGATDMDDAVDKNEAVGMAVRTPEQAMGSYSTLGLAVDNKSICEDCHNWQREVANAGAAPALPAILGKYVSHPQREVYHGRAMLEVPAASDFMPGAKCEQCHMPATRSDFPAKTDLPRYADRSWKRYSHRMFIMEPGDAEAWGLAAWGDSCSPCHAGETQSELQANLDMWQATAADLADEASSAIAAAVSGGRAVAAGDIDLLKRASANLSLFVQDGSGGAHNPTYEQAGLAKAVVLAKSAGGTLSISAPVKVSSGSIFGIQGMAMNGDGTHAAGVTLNLYRGATLVGTAVTDDMGNYGFAWAQTSGATYSVKWARSSQAVSDVTASAAVAMDVVKVETDLDLSINKTTSRRKTSITLSGNIDPAFSGATIAISYKKPGATSYTFLRNVTTNSSGEFSTTSTPGYLGTYTYRAKFAGDALHLGSSATAKVRVIR